VKAHVLAIGRRNLVVILAGIAAFGMIVDAVVAAHAGVYPEFWLRSGAAAMLFGATLLAEKVKALGGDS
jgi:hypothetical protein